MDLIYRYDPFQPVSRPVIEDAETASRRLRDGNDRLVEIVRRMQARTLGADAGEPVIIPVSPISLGLPIVSGSTLAQRPFALVLGCSDARVPTESIFDQSFNDLFVVRIAGNVLGTECLGSINYAVRNLSESLKLVVVLGHSGCGAVTAAVDSYLSPQAFGDIAFTYALRSLVDRIQIAVRGAAKALQEVGGAKIASSEDYRENLIETAVYLNSAVAAYDLQREIAAIGGEGLPVVYGIFDLTSMRVRCLPDDRNRPPVFRSDFGSAPRTAEDFANLGLQIAARLLEGGDVGASTEW
jgi:carbonic anhydrase